MLKKVKAPEYPRASYFLNGDEKMIYWWALFLVYGKLAKEVSKTSKNSTQVYFTINSCVMRCFSVVSTTM